MINFDAVQYNQFSSNLQKQNDILSRDVTIHNTKKCESRVLMIEKSQR
jgi:hypothetical protein